MHLLDVKYKQYIIYSCLNRTDITENRHQKLNLNRGSPTGFPSYTPVVRIECRVRDSVRVKVWIGTVLGIVLEYIGQNKIRPPSSPKEKCVYLIFELLLDSRSSVFS